MAIPSGSGTEVLKRHTVHANNATGVELLSGEAGHIYTVLSIVFCDQQNAAAGSTIDITIAPSGSGAVYLCRSQHVGPYGTFVWNDKFVLYETDDLDVYNSCTNGDWSISYIDQDWT